MLAVTLVFSVLFVILALAVGIIGGWIFREYIWSQRPENLHPELFDENGNVMPDEIIAFRFEQIDSEDDQDD